MESEGKNDPAKFANQTVARADFTYSMELDLIKIVDLNPGDKSVTNDVRSKLGTKAQSLAFGSCIGTPMGIDGYWDGYWDGVRWDGQHATFFAIREKSEAKQRRSC